MTDSQRIALRLSEARQTLNGLIEERNKAPETAPSTEAVSKMDEATRTVTRLETEYRAAVVRESGDEQRAEAENQVETRQDEDEAESREVRRLLIRSSLVPFLVEAVDGQPLEGAEKEVRAAILGDDAKAGRVPFDMLLPPPDIVRPEEHRADVVTPVAAAALADGSQASVLERVFARSVAARLGVAMPSVPAGSAVYPIMTGGTTAAQAADGTTVDAAAGSFTGHTLDPIRLTAAYLFNMRQTLQLSGFEAILRRDLRAVLTDKMDDQVLNGDSNAPNVTGFFSELPAATAAAAKVTWPVFLQHFTGMVDGLNAYNLSDLVSIVGKETFEATTALFNANAGQPTESAYEYVRSRIGGMSVSSRIAFANKKQTNIVALTSYPGRNAVAPIWRGLELIRDPYSGAAAGQVRLTAIQFWNFKVLRETGWKLFEVQTS